jgi:oxidase EvaA
VLTAVQQGIAAWLAERQRACHLTSLPLALEELPSWRWRAGRLAHVSGRFFSVVGVRARSDERRLDGLEQPLIDQPEVGILGFLLAPSADGPRLLVQAKAEPGNVHGVQLAPTVQATESNYQRVHGGAPTAFLERFLWPARRPVSDSLQSEQGGRFLGKYNRNQVVEVADGVPEPPGASWRWFPALELLAALRSDFAVNTDARSVLVCCDWDRLAPQGAAFARWRGAGDWRELLWRSAQAPAEVVMPEVRGAQRALAARRGRLRLTLERVPLEALAGWALRDGALVPVAGGEFGIVGRRVHAPGREVADWDQPLAAARAEGEVVLVAQLREGALRFLFRASAEIGFREGVQWGPTLQRPDGPPLEGAWGEWLAGREGGQVLASCLQSDEGGRFDRSTARYAVLLAPEGLADPVDDGLWLSLAAVRRLLLHRSMLTNEARSALSLLLGDL